MIGIKQFGDDGTSLNFVLNGEFSTPFDTIKVRTKIIVNNENIVNETNYGSVETNSNNICFSTTFILYFNDALTVSFPWTGSSASPPGHLNVSI